MNPYLGQLVACARVDAAGAAVMARGCATALPGGAGTGIYTVTMPVGVDATNARVEIQEEAADVKAYPTYTSDTVITVTIRSVDAAGAIVAADAAFGISIYRV